MMMDGGEIFNRHSEDEQSDLTQFTGCSSELALQRGEPIGGRRAEKNDDWNGSLQLVPATILRQRISFNFRIRVKKPSGCLAANSQNECSGRCREIFN